MPPHVAEELFLARAGKHAADLARRDLLDGSDLGEIEDETFCADVIAVLKRCSARANICACDCMGPRSKAALHMDMPIMA